MPRRLLLILVVLLAPGPLQGCATAGGLAPTPAPAIVTMPTATVIATYPPTWTPRPPTPTSTRVIPLTPTFTPGPSPTPTRFPARTRALVVNVLDAYTIEVLMDSQPVNRVFTVRLLGVERPLLSDPWAAVAGEWLTKEVTRQLVVLESDEVERDAQGNLLRYVWKEGRMVNVTMVQLGLLTASPGASDLRFGADLLAAQNDARTARRGVWGPLPTTHPEAATPSPLPPITATLAITTAPTATQLPTSAP